MTTLYFVRHGETLWNIAEIMQGWKDSSLSKNGIKQAQYAGKRLSSIDIDTIYCSPSGRAIQTAEIIRGSRDIKIIHDDNLREMNFGDWDGVEEDIFKRKNKEQYENFYHNPHKFIPSNGEDFEDVRKRVYNEVSKIALHNEGKTILIVSHAVAVKSVLTYFENKPISKLWDNPKIYQASISKVVFENNKYKILMYGDISHISQDMIDYMTKAI